MPRRTTLAIVSDIHYASSAEQARGGDYETRHVRNPAARWLLKAHRHFLWLRDPLRKNHLLDAFLAQAGQADGAIANGDYTCDTVSVGVSDSATCQSAAECLGKLRGRFGDRFRATFGDHELGKVSFVGGQGGMRLASFRCAREILGLEPFWRMDIGRYALFGLVSSLVALPVFEADALPEELPEWRRLREQHLDEIRSAFSSLDSDRRVLLFCHDPTALPFLWREEAVRRRLHQLEQTIIGHLHSHLILWKSRLLAGIPPVRFLGHSVTRMTRALREARYWKPFHVRLCPALAGIELLKDGGFYLAEIDPNGEEPVHFRFQRIPR